MKVVALLLLFLLVEAKSALAFALLNDFATHTVTLHQAKPCTSLFTKETKTAITSAVM